MKIEHIAVWVEDLETVRAFYERFFGARAETKYVNLAKQFESYFLSFESGARLELMYKSSIGTAPLKDERSGYAHLAVSVGSKERVKALTEQLRAEGFVIEGEPRLTGDGYFESVVLDPEGNRVEIAV